MRNAENLCKEREGVKTYKLRTHREHISPFSNCRVVLCIAVYRRAAAAIINRLVSKFPGSSHPPSSHPPACCYVVTTLHSVVKLRPTQPPAAPALGNHAAPCFTFYLDDDTARAPHTCAMWPHCAGPRPRVRRSVRSGGGLTSRTSG